MNFEKTKAIALLGVLAFGAASCAGKAAKAPGEIVIFGTVKNPSAGKITIQELLQNGEKGPEQEIPLKPDRTFKKAMVIKNPGYYGVNFFNAKQVTLILSDSDLEITVDCAAQNAEGEDVLIKGSPDHELVKAVKNILEPKNSEMSNLERQFRQASQEGNEQRMQEIQEQKQLISSRNEQAAADFMRKQPISFAFLGVLQNYFQREEQYKDMFEKAAAELTKKYPTSGHVKEFAAAVNREKKLAVGQPAPEISLPSPEGKTISLSSLRGKYVLVDFWASWCGPCREENPNVLAAYKKYKSKGFEVFGVSLDSEKEDWVKAIRQDSLAYTHVSDLKFSDSEVARTYNIEGIPMCYLIDPKGHIVAKNLRGPQLEKTLEKTLQ